MQQPEISIHPLIGRLRLNNVEGSDRMLLRCMLVIINHDITGNGIDKLKETRDELNEYLIKH